MAGIENSLGSERFAVVASAAATVNAANPLTTDWVAIGKSRRFALIALIGDVSAGDIVVTIEDATSAAGAGAATQKTATTLAANATDNDGKIVIINFGESDVDTAKPFIAGKVTLADTAGGPIHMALLAFDARHGPLSDQNLADVVQIVS